MSFHTLTKKKFYRRICCPTVTDGRTDRQTNKVVVDSSYKFPFELGPTDEFTELFDGKIEKLPMGPRAISLDFELPYHGQFVGIPERTSNKGNILLDDTVKFDTAGRPDVLGNPYRLFNLDVSDYQANETYLGLYGSIPLLIS